MKTNRLTVAIIAVCLGTFSQGQEWHANPPGNTILGGEYLGCNALSTQPLRLTTVANQPIDFSTADRFRARINPKISYPVGPAPNAPRDGFMLLSGRDNYTQQVKGPFTRLHLVDNVGNNAPIVYAQDIGYRQWMRNGITFTGNSDQAYLGQKYAGDDKTDFVIQWSDNPNGSPWGVDRMKFVFTTQYVPGALRGAPPRRDWRPCVCGP